MNKSKPLYTGSAPNPNNLRSQLNSICLIPYPDNFNIFALSIFRILPLILFVFALSACGPQESSIPDVRGQVISKQEATDLSFELMSKIFDNTASKPGFSIKKIKGFDVESILPRIHKWFTIGWGVRPHTFRNTGEVIYRVSPLPQFVVDDLEGVLVPNYTPHVPLILTASFWRDMKKLTEYPDQEVVLGFNAQSLDSAVIHTEGKTIFITFGIAAESSTLIHEGTHLRVSLQEAKLSLELPNGALKVSESCQKSLIEQMDEIDAYRQGSHEASRLIDVIAYWYTSWSDAQLRTFAQARIPYPALGNRNGAYQSDFGTNWVVVPSAVPGMRKLSGSCPTSLYDKVKLVAEKYTGIELDLLFESVVYRPNAFYKRMVEDLRAYDQGEASCLNTVRQQKLTEIEAFFSAPECETRFGDLRDEAQKTAILIENEITKPFLKEYFTILHDYHDLLNQYVIAYQRLSGNQNLDAERDILQYFPKELFYEGN